MFFRSDEDKKLRRAALLKRVDEIDSIPADAQRDWMELAMFNEALLEKEFRLANDRIGLVMTSQSILLGAFVILVTTEKASSWPWLSNLLLIVLPVVGTLLVLSGLLGFWAAHTVIDRLEEERSFYQRVIAKVFHVKGPDVGIFRDEVGRLYSWTQSMGVMPSFGVILMFLVVWIGILLAQIFTFLMT